MRVSSPSRIALTASSARGNPRVCRRSPSSSSSGASRSPRRPSSSSSRRTVWASGEPRPSSSRSWRCRAGSTFSSAVGVTRVVAITVTACAGAVSTALSAWCSACSVRVSRSVSITDSRLSSSTTTGSPAGKASSSASIISARGAVRVLVQALQPLRRIGRQQPQQVRDQGRVLHLVHAVAAQVHDPAHRDRGEVAFHVRDPARLQPLEQPAHHRGLADPAAPGHGHQPDPRIGHIPGQQARLDLPVLEPGRRRRRRRVDELRRPHRLRLGRDLLALDPAADPPPRVWPVLAASVPPAA